ncbi:MAG TPA: ABC transporter ATP-binding protein [Candidatus Paceibacterota bacterium]
MKALEIEHLVKNYGKTTAVKNVSFSIEPGEFFGFLGPNGAGKTTTIKCITGISALSKGTIHVFGVDVVKEYREARKKIGLAPQEFNVDIFATSRDILYYIGGFYGMRKNIRMRRIEEVLAKFELIDHAEKPFQFLSGGLKRRLMLARAMIHDPDLLILDEPTAGVDVELRHDLWRYLQELNKAGKTILLTSHYLEEVELLCNRIAIINKGQIAAIGDKKDFISGGRKLEQTYLDITKNGKIL